MHCFMKTLSLFSLCAGLASSATLSVRFEGDWQLIWGSGEPPSRDWTHFLITFNIDEFPTPSDCYPGCYEVEDGTPEFARYTTIPVTATVVKTGGWKGEKTEYTGPAFAMYFVDHTFGSGFQIEFVGNFNSYIMLFEPFELGYEPPQASPKILAMKTSPFQSGWIGGVCCPADPFFEPFYQAILIPEPGTMATLAAGIVGLGLFRRRLGRSR
jgi:hypothetical protein